MHVEPHHTTDRLAELIRAEPRARVGRRLVAVRLALLGRTAAQIAGEVLLSERSVRAWVARYNGAMAAALPP
jgi:transposase